MGYTKGLRENVVVSVLMTLRGAKKYITMSRESEGHVFVSVTHTLTDAQYRVMCCNNKRFVNSKPPKHPYVEPYVTHTS